MDRIEHVATILVVEDEEGIREILEFNLRSEHYEVICCESAEQALKEDLARVDLLILDIMLPGMSGLKLAERIRSMEAVPKPIIFLTAKDEENDLLTGFNLGADDYVTKPFSIKELMVRVRAVLMRSMPGFGRPVVSVGSLTIDHVGKRIYVDGQEVRLTKKEFEVLSVLAMAPGKVFSRETILSQVWGSEVYVLERTVDVHIARMRRKLGRLGVCIIHRTGYGYSYEPVEEEE